MKYPKTLSKKDFDTLLDHVMIKANEGMKYVEDKLDEDLFDYYKSGFADGMNLVVKSLYKTKGVRK